MAKSIAAHAAGLWAASKTAFVDAQEVLGVTRFNEVSFNAQPNISIDYAVMEKAERIVMVPVSFVWSDVGSWDAVASAHEADGNNNSARHPKSSLC